MMATKRLVGLALVVGVGVFGAPLEAQRGPGGWVAGPGPHMGRSLEVALEHQAELGLTQDQIARLTEIHAALDRDVFPLTESMKALRESIWAGEMDRAEGFRQMEALRGELIMTSAPLMGRVQEILTADQHRRLQVMMRQLRPGFGAEGVAPFGRLRGGAMAPMAPGPGGRAWLRGGRGGAGVQPGFRGPGRLHQRWWRGPDPSDS
jgi:Spy/CpxP family protein refolding chaperone